MELTRRDFLKASGAGIGAAVLFGAAGSIGGSAAAGTHTLHKQIGEKTTTCPYCGVGCGAIMAVQDGKLVSIEGDPDHPVNEGSLCPKGASLYQIANNEQRVTKVLYRSAGGSSWEEKTWDWALGEIASRIKQTRDDSWVSTDGDGYLVNRTEAIASVGSVFPNSEEAYLMTKMQRALGLVYIENEARVCVSSAVAANDETLGRGPMTNHWIDLGNSDCVMVIGGNVAESFPIAFKWVTRAKEKGAKLIHVDPRFTRTSAMADIYARMRTGTDVAFVGGIIKYVLDDIERFGDYKYNMDYIKNYTNAPLLINSAMRGPQDSRMEVGGLQSGDGLFSWYDPATGSYDKSTWQYQVDGSGVPLKDDTLAHSNCVFQIMKKHFARYDVDTVCQITGTNKETYLEVCQTYAATGAKGKAGAIIFSSGACEHSHGTQNVRAYGILQLLLGNIGVSGGGLNGIAGASNGLGASLQGRLFHWLPGALPPPMAQYQTLNAYTTGVTAAASPVPKTLSGWTGRPKHIVSLLKAWYGTNATAGNDFGYHYLGKRGGSYTLMHLFEAVNAGTIEGLICWGMNPAVSAPNSGFTRDALAKLKWMVVIDLFETETAAFWNRSGVSPADIDTEVFFLPAACSLEKEGSVTSSARWMQWRNKGPEPPGDAKPDMDIINDLMIKTKELYQADASAPNRDAIVNLAWNYGGYGAAVDAQAVAKEINGYAVEAFTTGTRTYAAGELLDSLSHLQQDGKTSCGNWLYCGSYTEAGNMAARRDANDTTGIGLYPNWAWAWPVNRRIWWNRASVDEDGVPWDTQHPVIQWRNNTWLGDVADGGGNPLSDAAGYYPFIMNWEGRGRLFGPGRADGPLPEHYEPWESPVVNAMSSQQDDPALKVWESNGKGTVEEYPILATTFRLVEHLHTGSFTRNLPQLLELQPAMFVDISEELAEEKGISSGDKVVIKCARGQIEAVAVVTKRLRPFYVDGQAVHEIALPWHWGYMGMSSGDSANSLTPRVSDINTMIPEYRAFLCSIRKA